MTGILKRVYRAGLNGYRYVTFVREFAAFAALSRRLGRRPPRWRERFACLGDRGASLGFDRHYVYHTAWAARVLAGLRPSEHVDVSSSVYFNALVSAFVPIRFYDFRPPQLELAGLSCQRGDLVSLPMEDATVASLSCMHVVEHIGLGRYGDPLDPDGDRRAMSELRRVLAPGGNLLLVVPVGRSSIAFNAHRVYSFDEIRAPFEGLELVEFSLVPDAPAEGGLIQGATREMADAQRYGCGCFWFRRPAG